MLAEIAGFVRADPNTACASCGMTLVDSPFSGGDYFDVIMKSRSPYLAWGAPSSRGIAFRPSSLRCLSPRLPLRRAILHLSQFGSQFAGPQSQTHALAAMSPGDSPMEFLYG